MKKTSCAPTSSVSSASRCARAAVRVHVRPQRPYATTPDEAPATAERDSAMSCRQYGRSSGPSSGSQTHGMRRHTVLMPSSEATSSPHRLELQTENVLRLFNDLLDAEQRRAGR